MLKRFVNALNAWMYLPLVLTLAGNPAFAETTVRVDYGLIVAIEIYRTSDNPPINTGTVLGGIAGGVIGHQIGSGRGNTAATIVGAIGGAAIGNEIEKRQAQGSRYRITVRLDSERTLVVEETRDSGLRIGDRVRVEGNRIYRT